MRSAYHCFAIALLVTSLVGLNGSSALAVETSANPLGLSLGYGVVSDKAALSEFTAAGIRVIELTGIHGIIDDDAKIAELRATLDAAGVRLNSIHFPFTRTFNLSDPDVRERTIEDIKVYLNRLGQLGGRYLIVHPSREPIADDERAERFRLSRKSILELDAIMKSYPGLMIAIENLPRTCLANTADELLRLIEGTSPERIGICLDTNHMLKEDLLTFTRKTISRIVTVHISDYDFDDERHWYPGLGVNDWKAWAQLMRAGGYRGPWLYELSWPEVRGKRLTPRQHATLVKLNYQDYFAVD